MAVTLLEAQALISDNLQRGIVQSIYNLNPLAAIVPIETVQGNSYAYTEEDGAAEGSTSRALNADFVEGTAKFTRRTANLARIGGKAYVDDYIQTTGSNLNDQLQAQVDAKSKQTGIRYQNEFFNGDTAVDPNGFDGLKKLVAGRYEDVDPTAVLTLDDVDLVLDSVYGQSAALFMNAKTASRVNKLARDSGLLTVNDINLVGSKLSSYNGTQVVRTNVLGGSQILADGEIYAVRFGLDGVFGLQANLPTPKVFAPDSHAPGWTVRIDWYTSIAMKTGSAYRITRKLSA